MRRVAGLLIAALAGALTGSAVILALPEDGATPRAPRPSPPPILGDAPVPTVLAWTPRSLPNGYARAVRAGRGVAAATVVRSGTAWLTSWAARNGAENEVSAGLAVPVEVAAITPGSYLDFVPPAERPVFAELALGGALLGRSAAAIRGVGPGGVLRFGALALEVRDVVDDELVGAHEVVVSTRIGRRLGIVRSRYLLVAPRRGVSRSRIERILRAPLAPGVRLRVRGPGETPYFRHGDAVLAPVRLKELFGEFSAAPGPGGTLAIDRAWVAANIRTVRLPVLGSVTCHRRVIPLVRGALRELARRGLADLLDPADYAGCYSPRYANRDPGSGISHHAWGVALDLNASENPLGAEPRLDRRVVEVFERWGFTWGGRWLVPDGMHVEFLAYPRG